MVWRAVVGVGGDPLALRETFIRLSSSSPRTMNKYRWHACCNIFIIADEMGGTLTIFPNAWQDMYYQQKTTKLMGMGPPPIDPGPDLVCRMAADSLAQVRIPTRHIFEKTSIRLRWNVLP